ARIWRSRPIGPEEWKIRSPERRVLELRYGLGNAPPGEGPTRRSRPRPTRRWIHPQSDRRPLLSAYPAGRGEETWTKGPPGSSHSRPRGANALSSARGRGSAESR